MAGVTAVPPNHVTASRTPPPTAVSAKTTCPTPLPTCRENSKKLLSWRKLTEPLMGVTRGEGAGALPEVARGSVWRWLTVLARTSSRKIRDLFGKRGRERKDDSLHLENKGGRTRIRRSRELFIGPDMHRMLRSRGSLGFRWVPLDSVGFRWFPKYRRVTSRYSHNLTRAIRRDRLARDADRVVSYSEDGLTGRKHAWWSGEEKKEDSEGGGEEDEGYLTEEDGVDSQGGSEDVEGEGEWEREKDAKGEGDGEMEREGDERVEYDGD
eukprot:693943-Amorphochlora_amoeboformis.AAC.1